MAATTLSPAEELLDGRRLTTTAPGLRSLNTVTSPGAVLLGEVDRQIRIENLRWSLVFWLYPPRPF